MSKWIYSFGDKEAEGNKNMKALLGGKGSNLASMCLLGIPVPPGFTITTEVCTHYYNHNKSLPNDLKIQAAKVLSFIEKRLSKKFGDANQPLLVSVRSGARASMPGMMDTILNLGLNDSTVKGLALNTKNPRFAYDSYRRFIQMYSSVVLNIDHYYFEDLLELKKKNRGIELDTELTTEDLQQLVIEYKELVEKETGKSFPDDVEQQLWGAICAVFDSWMNARAITYRKHNNIPQEWGTAVNIQAMVFGNMGDTSATGVAFTRDPSTGENIFYGEYLINAQGEDVVAGIRTPQSITKLGKNKSGSNLPAMEESMPKAFAELVKIYKHLESSYQDMQDIEFTVQDEKLWILQTRSGKRSAQAAIKIAVDMVKEGLITEEQAILRIDPTSLDQLLHPTLDPSAKVQVIALGLPASPGAASGMVVFSADEAQERALHNNKVILVRSETSPEDIHGMYAAQGVLTTRGGMTSHAAVVARGMGKPCICGASELNINSNLKTITVRNFVIKEGDIITINGSTGEVILGEVPTINPNLSNEFNELMNWADKVRKLKVRANAETTLDAKVAKEFGAEGIGLCRTEHMFFEDERIITVREMIISNNLQGRATALTKLLPMQRQDFVKLFKIMHGLPVNIRLLDPPLHEFLPHTESEMQAVANAAKIDIEQIKYRSSQLHEMNPMLGHRGCRLGVSYPEIYIMQARAIFEAMVESSKDGYMPQIEIMVPLVMSGKEIEILKKLIDDTAFDVMQQNDCKLKYIVGTMIELPRAALMAGDIAHHAEYFSFGTNDLTQTTFGISRDDAGSFLQNYKDKHIIDIDPFVKLDEDGVGELIKIAIERSRKVKPNIKLGICGEHGGNPESIKFFHMLGFDYISCSPYRVPIARLAAAHAALEVKGYSLLDKQEAA
jgi:pyruvate,orthophosphate dikinase